MIILNLFFYLIRFYIIKFYKYSMNKKYFVYCIFIILTMNLVFYNSCQINEEIPLSSNEIGIYINEENAWQYAYEENQIVLDGEFISSEWFDFGIKIENIPSYSIEIRNVQISNKYEGIIIDGVAEILIINSILINTSKAIKITNAQNVRIETNEIINSNGDIAIQSSGSQSIITGNRMNGYDKAIRVYSGYSSIEYNSINNSIEAIRSGIYDMNFMVKGNSIINSTYGILGQQIVDSIIESNVLTNVTDGIKVSGSSNNITIKENRFDTDIDDIELLKNKEAISLIRANTQAIIVDGGAADIYILNNYLIADSGIKVFQICKDIVISDNYINAYQCILNESINATIQNNSCVEIARPKSENPVIDPSSINGYNLWVFGFCFIIFAIISYKRK